MEENPRLLWGYVEIALRPRRTVADATWMAALNRIYLETLRALGLPPGPALSQRTCDVANEHWSIEQVVGASRVPASVEAAPQTTPMLAVRRAGSCVLIDGAARAGRIAAEGSPGPHSVVVIVAPD
jgi:hypothetical protein